MKTPVTVYLDNKIFPGANTHKKILLCYAYGKILQTFSILTQLFFIGDEVASVV